MFRASHNCDGIFRQPSVNVHVVINALRLYMVSIVFVTISELMIR
jgi:hypothetical protein